MIDKEKEFKEKLKTALINKDFDTAYYLLKKYNFKMPKDNLKKYRISGLIYDLAIKEIYSKEFSKILEQQQIAKWAANFTSGL